MAYLKIKNRAFSTLAADIISTATSLSVAAGEGAKFPSAGDFHITIEDEILKCTAITTDTLTVTRAQEGTTAAAHTAGKSVELRITAGVIDSRTTWTSGKLLKGAGAGANPTEITGLADLAERAHSSLTGIGASDHHIKTTSSEIDHGSVLGLADDDHTQYLNVARHDVVARHPLSVLDSAVCSETEADSKITTHKGDASAHHTKTIDASELSAGELPTARLAANIKTASLTFIIDGGGSAITTGQKGHLEIPFACTITQVTMLADVSGSIVVDIWKDTYVNFPPADVDSITASAPPTISAAQKSQDSTLTGWTTAVAVGDILAFNVDSTATITRVTISLKVEKS